ncbi:SDR family NAD(P)-dependent oxidoreductase [Hypericibacter sp.]|uniref:SDR family NAD(P)-dependent oxidoreductase n=1 Tax=Hypericibacter sp. TaxID=2705401 RepID=UPI003D6D4008
MPPARATANLDRPQRILITGASSGIGAALASAYAASGVSLVLGGRDQGRLASAEASCRAKGAEIETAAIDVVDAGAVRRWIEAADDRAPLDLVIANAGISAGTGTDGESEAQARAIFATNVDGVANTVWPALRRMERRGQGQIALMSSLAAFRGFPGAPAYCASKAAIRVWGEGLRGEYRAKGVAITVICPGYVESPMTAVNDFPMPFLMNAERAARIIRRGLARNRARIAFPLPMYFGAWLLGVLSPGLTDPLLARLPKKG